jgi:hypothetical protein
MINWNAAKTPVKGIAMLDDMWKPLCSVINKAAKDVLNETESCDI